MQTDLYSYLILNKAISQALSFINKQKDWTCKIHIILKTE